MEKKEIKISLTTFIISIVILLLIVGGLICYILSNKNRSVHNAENNTSVSSSNTTKNNVTNSNKVIEEEKVSDYFILYNGYEMDIKTGIQDISEMKISEEAKEKYNTIYYNYENGKYVGTTTGNFGEEIYEGVSAVGNVSKIAISKKYDAIPRTFTTIKDLPEELKDMADYSSVDINSIDLDGDSKNEYVVCYTINYVAGEIGNGEPEASSGIMLFDSNFKKIADLVSLENGFWANIKEEYQKRFLSLSDVDYIDIDNDGVMEIIIQVPTYEGVKISIVKYSNGKIEGETNFQASVLP